MSRPLGRFPAGALRTSGTLLLVMCVLAAGTSELSAAAKRTVAQKKRVAASQYDKATKLREALKGKPDKRRRSADYQRVIQAFRSVYYVSPTSSKADDSVLAVAELLAESGRTLKRRQAFQDAIGQYEYLLREYPHSRLRYEAQFAIAQIYREDLRNSAKARAGYEELVKKYPQHELAEQARKALAEMESEEKEAKAARTRKPATTPANTKEAKAEVAGRQKEAPAAAPSPAPLPTPAMSLLTGIRHWSTPDYTRVAIDLEQEVKYEAGRVAAPDRIFFDLHDTRLASELAGKSFELETGFLKKVRVAQFSPTMSRVVLEVSDLAEYSAFLLPNPYRLIIDVHGRTTPPAAGGGAEAAPKASDSGAGKDATKELATGTSSAGSAAQVKATAQPTSGPTFESVSPRPPAKNSAGVEIRQAQPNSAGERSLIRVLGLKVARIVIDAGHGGHDTGTIGPNGLTEKELVLDVALRLGQLLESKLGAEVIYTREDDTFVPLETRTAIANKHQADLFISVHANASRDRKARGVETYYLNFTSNAEALEVAARENAVSEKSVFELQDLVKKIAMKEKIEESREFAAEVQRALHKTLAQRTPAIRNRGVKKAPFVVLIGANMPSVLAEISFLTNPSDEKQLRSTGHRQRIAEALFQGVSEYASGLSNVRVASKTPVDAPAR